MNDSHPDRGVIPARTVRRLNQTALVECGSGSQEADNSNLTIVPLVEGDQVAGLEIRCACGASAIVECVYGAEEKS